MAGNRQTKRETDKLADIEEAKAIIREARAGGMSACAVLADMVDTMARAMGMDPYELCTHVLFFHLEPPKEAVESSSGVLIRRKSKPTIN